MAPPIDDPQLPIEPIRPVASPVDTYVRPATNSSAGSSLMELARSLSAFAGPLNDYVQEHDRQEAENQALSARADFMRNNSAGYEEAVRQGLIPATASPAYVNAYKQAQGDLAGSQLEQEAQLAYDQWDGKNSEDPQAFNAWFGGFLKDRLGPTTDPRVLKGLLPRVRQMQSSLTARHIEDQHRLLVTSSAQALGTQANQAMDDAALSGLSSGATDYESAFKTMEANRQARLSAGMLANDADTATMQAAASMALSSDDPKWLGWFSRKVPGESYTYGDTPAGKALYEDTKEKLEVLSRRRLNEATERQNREDRIAKEKSEADALDIIAKDPSAPLPEALNAQGKKYNGAWEAQLLGWRKQFQEAEGSTDPHALAAVQLDMMASPSAATSAVVSAFKAGRLGAKDFQTTYSFAQSLEEHSAQIDKVLTSRQVTQYDGNIKDATKPDSLDNVFAADGLSDEGRIMQSDFHSAIIEHIAKNPNESVVERLKAIDAIAAYVIGHKPAKGANGSPDSPYQRPADFDWDNPFISTKRVLPPPPPKKVEVPVDNRWWWQKVLPDGYGGRDDPTKPPPSPVQPGGQAQGQQPQAPEGAIAHPLTPQQTAPEAALGPNADGNKALYEEADQWLASRSPAFRQRVEDMAGKVADPRRFKVDLYRNLMRLKQPQGSQGAPAAGVPPSPPAAAPVSPLLPAAPSTPPAGKISFEGTSQSPGEMVDAALASPEDALGLLQRAVDQTTLYEDAQDAMQRAALSGPAPLAFASTTGLPPGTPFDALPAGMRNNNPGNIKFTGSPWQRENFRGILGPSRNTDQGDPQIVFRSAEDGMASMAALALSKFDAGKTTVRDLIAGDRGWTPGSQPAAENVARSMGVSPDAEVDLRDPAQLRAFMRATIRQEHGDAGGLYPDALIDRGISLALAGKDGAGPEGDMPTAQTRQFLLGKLAGGAKARGEESITGMKPQLQARLAAFLQAAPPEIAQGLGVFSGYRSQQVQDGLFARSDGSGRMVARHSQHTEGTAADLSWNGVSLAKAPKEVIQWVHQNAGRFGLKFPMNWENWHVELRETRGGDEKPYEDNPFGVAMTRT